MDRELIEILACPICKGDLEYKDNFLICEQCIKKFPVRDDIPILLKEEAEKL